MTNFSGPFNIKRHQSETTVVSFDASGSATYAQGADFGGAVRVAGQIAAQTIEVSGSVAFKGRVQGGADNAATLSEALFVKRVAIPANNTKVTAEVPDGSDIIRCMAFVQTPPGGSAQSTCNILVGTSAHDGRLLALTNVSTQGYYDRNTLSQTSAWSNVSGTNAKFYVHTSAVSGAIASGTSGFIGIEYIRKQ